MRLQPIVTALLLLAFACPKFGLSQNADEEPQLTGRVTAIRSSRDFDVDGMRIVADSKTRIGIEEKGARTIPEQLPIVLGQTARVFGKRDRKHHSVIANEVWLVSAASGDGATLAGTAGIDLIPPAMTGVKPGSRLIRADGYRILITANTVFNSTLPDPTLAGIQTNTWITYHGIRKSDGIVIADKVSIVPNEIGRREDKLLDKTDYDPDKVDPNAKQGKLSKFAKGIDPKQIPPYPDSTMQARIERIGSSLIPAYQRALPESDLTKIIFRFQLVDQEWHDAITFPSGIILVPHQVVEHLQNDSQLATVLADNIACALEKQTFRAMPSNQVLGAANLAGLAGGFFVPGLGIATGLVTGGTAATIARHDLEQSGRVSLTLLRDAGYDIREAPRTWWLLNSKKTKDPKEIAIPARANYLYDTLASTWADVAGKP